VFLAVPILGKIGTRTSGSEALSGESSVRFACSGSGALRSAREGLGQSSARRRRDDSSSAARMKGGGGNFYNGNFSHRGGNQAEDGCLENNN